MYSHRAGAEYGPVTTVAHLAPPAGPVGPFCFCGLTKTKDSRIRREWTMYVGAASRIYCWTRTVRHSLAPPKGGAFFSHQNSLCWLVPLCCARPWHLLHAPRNL